ncbi:hypothetical protein NON20_10210 [Synechocystis sp. B12]|nr:hypothetical protein NON20_10210 [Synechocystis sp. B12]
MNNLKYLTDAKEINLAWSSMQNQPIIDHPEFGKISPNDYRAKYNRKICPFCAQRMVHGQDLHMTRSRNDAISRKYEYVDKNGEKKSTMLMDDITIPIM